MAITKEQVERALDQVGLKHHKVEDHILILMGAENTNLQLLVGVFEDGEYIDVSALKISECDSDSPNLEAVLEVLAHANYRYRLTKFGWDPSDGEIRARTCLPIEDNTRVTAEQMRGLIGMLTAVVDETWPDLQSALGR